MRCVACNCVLGEYELVINPHTNELDDMCFGCKAKAFVVIDDDEMFNIINELLDSAGCADGDKQNST